MKNSYQKIRQFVIDSKHLLWPFKWYILFYIGYLFLQFSDMFDPTNPDDPIFNSEAMHDSWEYTNYEVYTKSGQLYFWINILIFFLALSNIRNHPKLAKLILISPLIFLVCGLVLIVAKWCLA